MIMHSEKKRHNVYLFSAFSFLFFTSMCCAERHIPIQEFSERRNSWRPIQKKIRDTVVQIFIQGAHIDLLHPYKSPEQFSSRASGFFINKKGDIITNAHVVNQAIGIWIQIPSLGKYPIQAELISVCPEKDLALLRLSPEGFTKVKQELGKIPFLSLGDSDQIYRSDEVLVLGYPLGQESLKSTTGVISGRELDMIQMDAAINPGSSGGPMLNTQGEVIGITRSGFQLAQNTGYMIPVNLLKIILDDMYKIPLRHKPFIGLLSSQATTELTDYLGNPQPGGTYVVEVFENSVLDKAGLKQGDMIYEIDNHQLDIYGEMSLEWAEDKISIHSYISQLKIGQEVNLVFYRSGEKKETTFTITQDDPSAIREVYPGYEDIDYEVFAGMVVMPLTINHLNQLGPHAPGLIRYVKAENRQSAALVVTHIFQNSELFRSFTISPGSIINTINGHTIKTLEDFRNAIKDAMHEKHFVIRATQNTQYLSDNIVVALSVNKILEEAPLLAEAYRYSLSPFIQELLTLDETS